MSNYIFINGDICNEKLVLNLFEEYKFSSVFHFAAESHVDNSFLNSINFISPGLALGCNRSPSELI